MTRDPASAANAGGADRAWNQPDGSRSPNEQSSSGSNDSISTRDLEECVRLLDEVWPHAALEHPEGPRRLGRFAILREIGRGGFGVVFLAEDPLLGRPIALKVPRIEVLSESRAWRRFLREARTASRLDHPNLVPLLEAGTIGPVGYIASAFVDGPTLERCLKNSRVGAPARLGARLIATLAGALEHMHVRGVLHRDLKPANILIQAPDGHGELGAAGPWNDVLGESWVPRICDFGLATLREIDGDETRTRSAAGSPPYMSPEQAEARHDEIGPATDIYGLGATLYQLLTGQPPFSGASELETLRRVVADEPTRPRQLRRDVPRDLETICLKCLCKRPEQRYPSAAELARDLERFLAGRPIEARPVPFWERGWKWVRRRPAIAALAAAATLAVIAGFGGFAWHTTQLRRINEQLRDQKTRAESNARDALDQRKLVEERERMLRRQLRGHQVFAAQQAVLAGNFELAHRMLDPPDAGQMPQQAPGFAWSWLWRSVRDRLEVVARQGGPIDQMAVDRSGRYLAAGGAGGHVTILDRGDRRAVRLPPAPLEAMHCIALSANGRFVAACDRLSQEIHVWDVACASIIARLRDGSVAAVSALLWSDDDKRLLVVRDQRERGALPLAGWEITSSTGDFSRLAPGEIATAPEATRDERLAVIAELLDIQPATQFPAAQCDRLKESLRLRRPRGLATTRDGALAVLARGDGEVRAYRISSGQLLASCRFGTNGTAIVLEDATEHLKEASRQDVERCDLLAKRLAATANSQPPKADIVVTLRWSDHFAYSADGRRLAVWRGYEHRLNIIDLTTGQEEMEYNLGSINAQSVLCFLAGDSMLALGGLDHAVRLWHLAPPQNPVVIRAHSPKEAWAVAFAPGGRTLASAGDDGCIRLWDVETGQAQGVLRGHDALVSCIAFAPDGRTLVGGSFDDKERLILWDLASRRPKFALRGHTGNVRGVAFSPDCRSVASAGDDATIMLWDTSDGRCVTRIPTGSRLNCIAFSPVGRTLAAGERSGRITLVDLMTLDSRTIDAVAPVESLTFSPDGSQIISGHDGGLIMIWDAATGNRIRELSGHYVNVFDVATSPDGTTIASAGHDRSVILWDPATGQQLLRLAECKAQVNAVAFSPDGQLLAAADHTGAITIWSAGPAVEKPRLSARVATEEASPDAK
jgi:eukaryotic-like serine/threonine-protein kinase